METMTTNPSLTPNDCDWLRKVRAACDAGRRAPSLPAGVACKLADFGFSTSDARGAAAITDEGREALLEQDMRDAEQR
jgi:hypothetical protein